MKTKTIRARTISGVIAKAKEYKANGWKVTKPVYILPFPLMGVGIKMRLSNEH